jgi:heme oxygenase
LDWQGTVIVPAERRKCAWLEADLLYLGIDPGSVAGLQTCLNLPAVGNVNDGLGVLYVLEGSTLGGQVILRALRAALNISPMAGGQFFASHDKATGAMWRSYLDTLEDVGAAPDAADAIESAALATFAAFDRWFDEGHRT